jgi:hypothetical protein
MNHDLKNVERSCKVFAMILSFFAGIFLTAAFFGLSNLEEEITSLKQRVSVLEAKENLGTERMPVEGK